MTKAERKIYIDALAREYSKARKRARDRIYRARKSGIEVDTSILPKTIKPKKSKPSVVEKEIEKLNKLTRENIKKKATKTKKKTKKKEVTEEVTDEEWEYPEPQGKPKQEELREEDIGWSTDEDSAEYINEAYNVLERCLDMIHDVEQNGVPIPRRNTEVFDKHKADIAANMKQPIIDAMGKVEAGDRAGYEYARHIEERADELVAEFDTYMYCWDSKQPYINEPLETQALVAIEQILFNTVSMVGFTLENNYEIEDMEDYEE